MSFLSPDLADAHEDIIAIARRLCGADVTAAKRCGGGGNNRVYRIDTQRSSFALKMYGPLELDGRDRLGREYGGLRFLGSLGDCRGIVPAAVAVDYEKRCALYTWIEARPLERHHRGDIAALLDFLGQLHEARTAAGAHELPLAAEAVLHNRDLIAQIDARLECLGCVADAEPDLAMFIAYELEPQLRRWRLNLRDNAQIELAPSLRTLSPSDCGFHNALRRPNGSLAFIDFEYFGWDDPTKLTADILWHPAMRLNPADRCQLLDGLRLLYGCTDPSFEARLRIGYPLFGIRWILIILNEFLPLTWNRRKFAGDSRNWRLVKREQLDKARFTLATLSGYADGEFYS